MSFKQKQNMPLTATARMIDRVSIILVICWKWSLIRVKAPIMEVDGGN